MSILQSFFIKLGMLAMTMGVVLWIGWQVPQTMQQLSRSGGRACRNRSI